MHETNGTGAKLSCSEENISPFLAKAGTPRIGEDKLPGYYCDQQKMWVIETRQGTQPIINENVLSQLQTKTRAHEEEDDESYIALDLMTKTNHQIESDDESWPTRYNNILQLVTKTDSIQEADDNISTGQLLGMVTKTKVQQEADDDDFYGLKFYC